MLYKESQVKTTTGKKKIQWIDVTKELKQVYRLLTILFWKSSWSLGCFEKENRNKGNAVIYFMIYWRPYI